MLLQHTAQQQQQQRWLCSTTAANTAFRIVFYLTLRKHQRCILHQLLHDVRKQRLWHLRLKTHPPDSTSASATKSNSTSAIPSTLSRRQAVQQATLTSHWPSGLCQRVWPHPATSVRVPCGKWRHPSEEHHGGISWRAILCTSENVTDIQPSGHYMNHVSSYDNKNNFKKNLVNELNKVTKRPSTSQFLKLTLLHEQRTSSKPDGLCLIVQTHLGHQTSSRRFLAKDYSQYEMSDTFGATQASTSLRSLLLMAIVAKLLLLGNAPVQTPLFDLPDCVRHLIWLMLGQRNPFSLILGFDPAHLERANSAPVVGFYSRPTVRLQKHYFYRYLGATKFVLTNIRLLKHDLPVHGPMKPTLRFPTAFQALIVPSRRTSIHL